jgi:hypothetical protein
MGPLNRPCMRQKLVQALHKKVAFLHNNYTFNRIFGKW